MNKFTQKQADKFSSRFIFACALIAPFFAFSHLFPWNDFYEIKTNKGSTIKFKKENVECDVKGIRLADVGLYLNRDGIPPSPHKKGKWRYGAECTANGIKTDMLGNEYLYNGEERCTNSNKNKITCSAAVYFGRFNYDQVD